MSRRIRTKEELLAELDTLDLPEETLATFRRVVNTVEENLTDAERRDYEVDLEKYIKTMGMIRTGREEGREEGRLEGRLEGSRQKAIEAAKNLLKMNLGSPEQIAQASGLPLQKVLELQEEIKVKV